MKKVTNGALIVMILLIVGLTVGAYTNGAPSLVYVYSNSMEPLIKVNDAFLIWPEKSFEVGDIIVYRPLVLEAPYITHRIVDIGANGYITKGDNSISEDQAAGEPTVEKSRIIGKVVTYHGQPLLIPQLGKVSSSIQALVGGNTQWLAGLFLILAIVNWILANKRDHKKKKAHNRYRLKHLYRAITFIAVAVVVLSIYLGAQVTQIKYLVSESPTNLKEQVAFNKVSTLTLVIKNNGLIPILPVVRGIEPLDVAEPPQWIGPFSSSQVILLVQPQKKIGVYYGYVQVYKYPAILPRSWILESYQISPYLTITLIGGWLALLLTLFLFGLSKVPGFAGWIPIKAIQDKLLDRRLQRVKSKIIAGRRRNI